MHIHFVGVNKMVLYKKNITILLMSAKWLKTKKMTTKEKNIVSQLKEKIKEKDPSAEIILFGSHARGDAGKESDWDILVLLNSKNVSFQRERELRHNLLDVELEIGEPISVFVYSKEDWENKFCFSPFYKNVKEEGILLL